MFILRYTFTGGWVVRWLGGWLDKLRLNLSKLQTKLKLKLSLAKMRIGPCKIAPIVPSEFQTILKIS